ncbi:MAG: sigma 54-interacting transcriptional regulator, partial [Coriobacteriia bacterium]|nr:sigma 54-interacting transcriptional regulator [Coriobacteriia bacterium]
ASLALFDIMMEGQGFSYLVIDEHENVVNISRRLLDMLNLRGGTTIGASARELFPELAPLFDACKRITRKNVRTKIDGITLNGAPTWAIASLLPSEEYVMTGIALKTASLDAAGMARRGMSVDRAFAGRSPAISRMKDAMRKAAAREKDVLITGECGTGKSTAAKIIHAISPRRNSPFILCNCALIPDDEVEPFLFGTADGLGVIDQACNGTLFFDGIEELSPKAQAVLVDLLDARSGGLAPGRGTAGADVRIIFSSRIDAFELARDGVLSPSFCYRLPSLVIAMPPLRDCVEDIPLIAQSLLAQRLEDGPFDAKADLPALDEFERLSVYPWPNNVLELKSALDWAFDNAVLNGRSLDGLVDEVVGRKTELADWRLQSPEDNGKVSSPGSSLQPELRYDDLERDELVDALRRNRGNKTSASRELGIARTTLYAKMKKHGLI